MDRVVATLDRPLEVPPRPFADRHTQVRLDDTGLHLGEEVLLQPGQMGRASLREGVLGPKEPKYLGVVALSEPEPVVDPLVPVRFDHGGTAGGDRRPHLGLLVGLGWGHRRMIPDRAPAGRTTTPGLLLSR